LIEALAALVGFDEAGGGPGYRPLDHSRAVERGGGGLGEAFRATWLPMVKTGWFFKAESFFSVARYLDQAALDANETPPDFLSHSHGEGFLRFFDERLARRGLYFFDEPESALSPKRQLDFLRVLRRMAASGQGQAIMATHSPLLMAAPGARLLRLTRGEIAPAALDEIEHFRLLRAFCADPKGFVAEALEEQE
jgi:predicted ATPase